VEQYSPNLQLPQRSRHSERILLILFLLFLPLLNPWIRSDAVGYYAFARAPLIQHNLDFARDYQSANCVSMKMASPAPSFEPALVISAAVSDTGYAEDLERD
jgi:hypothetical protein